MITKSRARTVARNDADAAAKILLIQEQQIAALEAEIAAQDAIITALMWGVWDYVTETGEVIRVQWGVPKTM
jgi:hypothetical protein